MLFSIIVPVFNVEKYLANCIDSIMKQSCSNYEVILVDDGSSDSSGTICDKYALKCNRIRVIHKQNGGLSEARNTGVKFAIGDYLLFVDSDDYIAADSLKEIEKVILEEGKPDIVCLECVKFYEKTNTTSLMNDGVTSKINDLSGDSLYYYIGSLNKFPASACTKAINRDFFIKNKLFFEKGKLSEDLEWAMRLFLNIKKAAYCPAQYYNYRQSRAGSISTTATEKNMMHILDTVQKGYEMACKDISNGQRTMLYSFIEYIYRLLILGYSKIKKENRKAYKKILKDYKKVLGTRKDITSRIIRCAYKTLGVSVSSKLMAVYLNRRTEITK